MSSKGAKRQSVVPNDKQVVVGETVADEEAENEKEKGEGTVTSQLRIKPGHTASNLEKEVVLRRIRQRRRMNKVRSAFQAFLSLPFSSSKTEEQPQRRRWLDDPFAAL